MAASSSEAVPLASDDTGNSADVEANHLVPVGRPRRRAFVAGRPFFRIAYMLLLLAITFGLWLLCISVLGQYNQTAVFNNTYPEMLSIQVSGCDVDIVPSDTAGVDIAYEVWGHSTSHQLDYFGNGIGPGYPNLKNVQVLNKNGCTDAHEGICGHICKVTVRAPQDTYGFWIRQDANDPAVGVEVRVRSGVRLQELRVVGLAYWSHAGPTISLLIEDDVELDNVAAYTDNGPVNSFSRGVKAASFHSLRNSVRLMNWELKQDNATVLWRQPENKVCIRAVGAEGASVEDDREHFKYCDVSSFGGSFKKLTGAFDGDGDGFIDTAELNKGFSDNINMCCGGDCPFFSYCGGYEAQIFSLDLKSGNAENNAAGIITNTNFVERVHDLNHTFWVPACVREVTLPHPQNSPSGDTLRSTYDYVTPEGTGVSVWDQSEPFKAKLLAESGEVQVFGIQGDTEVSNRTVTAWAPEARIQGIRMLKSDADTIRTEITNTYGLPGQPDNIYVILDVMPSSGVPRSRWVYTVKEFYLSLEPVHLQFLSAGLLLPEIKYYRVHFTNTLCEDLNMDEVELTAEEMAEMYSGFVNPPEILTEATAKQVFSQLQKSLLPRFQTHLRGMLVLLNSSHAPEPGTTQLVAFDTTSTTGSETIVAVEYTTVLLRQTRAGAGISVAMALILSTLVMYLILKYSRFVLRRAHKAEKLKKRLMMLNLESISDPTTLTGALEDLEEESKDHAGSTAEDNVDDQSFNPLEMPLILIRSLVVNPIRKAVTNSLEKFLHERCHVYIPERVETPGTTSPVGSEIPEHLKSQTSMVRYKWVPQKKDHGGPLHNARVEPCIPLPKFFKEYTMFCFEEDLHVCSNLNQLQRDLIRHHKCMVRMLKIRRFLGCRFHSPAQIKEAYTGQVWPDGSAHNPGSFGTDLNYTSNDKRDTAIVLKFLRDFIEPTGDKVHMLSIWRPARDKRAIGGISVYHAMESWCQFWKIPMPNMTDIDMEAIASELGSVSYVAANVKEIRGIELKNLQDPRSTPNYGAQWYRMEFLTVFMQMAIMLILPAICLSLALSIQYVYGTTTALPGAAPLMSYDIMRVWPRVEGKKILLITQVLAYLNFAYMCTALLRIFIHYLGFSQKGLPVKIIRKVFAVILMVYLWAIIAYFALIGVWFSLAAVLDPTRFLPYGTAVVVLVGVIVVTYKAMSKAAAFLRKALKDAFQRQINTTIKSSGGSASLAISNNDGLRKRKNPAGEDIASTAMMGTADVSTEELRPEDIFDFLNADGNDVLSLSEFRDLFKKLDLNLSSQQQDHLIAYCDLDCSHTISQEEFLEGWEYVVEEMVQQTLEEMGLGSAQIFVIIAVMVVLLIMWFAFLFLLISVWNSEGGFAAAVQSLIIAGSGGLSTTLRKRGEAEADGQSVDSIVKGIMGTNKEGLADDAEEAAAE